MEEKKLEKLIVDGFKAQDKKIDLIKKEFNGRFDEQQKYMDGRFDVVDKQFKELRLEMVTQDDLDQKFENNTQLIIREMDRRTGETNQRFNHIIEEIKDIRTTLEEINVRNNEEVADLYKRVNLLEKKVSQLLKAQA